jgi:hypothetical protein
MEKLKEVAEARAIMTEGIEWSVMKWLTEKKRVRKAADLCNATLDRVEQELHDAWDADLKAAYEQLSGDNNPRKVPAEVQRVARSIKETHDAAIAARADAEDTFEKAEKRMSAGMAREGCHKAIAGWDLHEEAIRKAELAAARK